MNRETKIVYQYLIPLAIHGTTPLYLPYLPFNVRCRIAKKLGKENWEKNLIYSYNNWVTHKVVKLIIKKGGK